MAAATPSTPTTGMVLMSMPLVLMACTAPRASSSFWAITPWIWPGNAVSQFSIRPMDSARDQLAVLRASTFTSLWRASTSSLPRARSICADWPMGPSMTTILPLPPMAFISA